MESPEYKAQARDDLISFFGYCGLANALYQRLALAPVKSVACLHKQSPSLLGSALLATGEVLGQELPGALRVALATSAVMLTSLQAQGSELYC
jgi:hypothetical protein